MTTARFTVTLDDGRDVTLVLEGFSLTIGHDVVRTTSPLEYPRFRKALTLTSGDFRLEPITVTHEELAAAFGLTPEQLDEWLARQDEEA